MKSRMLHQLVFKCDKTIMVSTVNISVFCSKRPAFSRGNMNHFPVCVCAVNMKSRMLHQLVFKCDKTIMVSTVNISVLCAKRLAFS
jgi:hypothetical protein